MAPARLARARAQPGYRAVPPGPCAQCSPVNTAQKPRPCVRPRLQGIVLSDSAFRRLAHRPLTRRPVLLRVIFLALSVPLAALANVAAVPVAFGRMTEVHAPRSFALFAHGRAGCLRLLTEGPVRPSIFASVAAEAVALNAVLEEAALGSSALGAGSHFAQRRARTAVRRSKLA